MSLFKCSLLQRMYAREAQCRHLQLMVAAVFISPDSFLLIYLGLVHFVRSYPLRRPPLRHPSDHRLRSLDFFYLLLCFFLLLNRFYVPTLFRLAIQCCRDIINILVCLFNTFSSCWCEELMARGIIEIGWVWKQVVDFTLPTVLVLGT